MSPGLAKRKLCISYQNQITYRVKVVVNVRASPLTEFEALANGVATRFWGPAFSIIKK